jgi:hypothetical protein
VSDLATKSVPVPPRNGAEGGQALQGPVGSEAETKEKREAQDSGRPRPPTMVLAQKPSPPVVEDSAGDNVADVTDLDEPATGQAFDLRGPVPPVGFKVRERVTLNGVRKSEFHKPNAKPIMINAVITKELENVYTVKAVAASQVTEYCTVFNTGHVTSSFVGLDGRRRTAEKVDNLIEETVISKKVGREWVHRMLNHEPTAKQAIALAQLAPWFADRDSFPRERQVVGSSWDIDKAHIRKLLGGGIGAISGKVQATFARLQQHEKENFAEIDVHGSILGRFDFSEPPDIIGTIDLDLSTLRSLATGLDTTTTGKLSIQANYKTDLRGPVDVAEVTSLEISSSATIEK